MSETRISQQVAALEQRLADYEANYPALEQENRELTAEVQRLTAERDSWRIEARTAEAALGAERQDAARLREALAYNDDRINARLLNLLAEAIDSSGPDGQRQIIVTRRDSQLLREVAGRLNALAALTAPADPTGGQE